MNHQLELKIIRISLQFNRKRNGNCIKHDNMRGDKDKKKTHTFGEEIVREVTGETESLESIRRRRRGVDVGFK